MRLIRSVGLFFLHTLARLEPIKDWSHACGRNIAESSAACSARPRAGTRANFICSPQRGLSDISVLSKSCDGRNLSCDRAVILRMSAEISARKAATLGARRRVLFWGGPRDEDEGRGRHCRRTAARDQRSRSGRASRRRSPRRDQGDRHLSYRRVHAIGRRSGGALSRHSRPRGRGRGGRRRRRRDQRRQGRSRHPALHARMPPVPVVPVAQDQSLHRDPRHPGAGRDAGRDLAVLARQGQDLPLYGLLDLLELHRPAGDRGRQSRSRPRRSTRSATSAAASRRASAP